MRDVQHRVMATGLLVAVWLALQYSDRFDGLLAGWVVAVWVLLNILPCTTRNAAAFFPKTVTWEERLGTSFEVFFDKTCTSGVIAGDLHAEHVGS